MILPENVGHISSLEKPANDAHLETANAKKKKSFHAPDKGDKAAKVLV